MTDSAGSVRGPSNGGRFGPSSFDLSPGITAANKPGTWKSGVGTSIGGGIADTGIPGDSVTTEKQLAHGPTTADSFDHRAPTTVDRLTSTLTTAEQFANNSSELAEQIPNKPAVIAEQMGKKSASTAEQQRGLNQTVDANRIKNEGLYNLTPLAGPAGMAARREFNGIPLRQENAYQAYRSMSADSFAGPDDIRLGQLKQAARRANVTLVRQLSDAIKADAQTYGRAKTPFTIFGKLREAPGSTIGQIKGLSGARIDVNPKRPGFEEYYKAQAAAQDALGEGLTLKQDYIKQPNRWGYTGRIHSTMTETSGLTHEIQVGSQDLSEFIDHNLATVAGDHIALHDVTGYKGQLYGVRIPDELQREYTQLMKRITDTNGAGQKVADVPELQRDINRFHRAVEDSLPPRLSQSAAPEFSRTARIGNATAKGFGVLGVAGSALQTVNGVNILATGGDKVEGIADLGAGTTGMISGTALIGGRLALGTTTGRVVATIDGAKDLYTGFRDADVEKTVVGTIKSGAGVAMMYGVATVNPALIAGGAIVYGGAVIY